MTQEELKEFEEQLPEEFFMHDNCECWNESGEPRCYQREQIKVKDFINNLLKSRQEKMIEEIEKSKKEENCLYAQGFNDGLDKGIEIVNSLKNN